MAIEGIHRRDVDPLGSGVTMNRQREQPLAHSDGQRSNQIGERAHRVNRWEIAAIEGAFEQLDQLGVTLVDGLGQRNSTLHRLVQCGFDLRGRDPTVDQAAG